MARVQYSDNPIVSGYPGHIYSGDVRKKCDTHFRVWLQIARVFDDPDLSPAQKALYAIELSGIEHTDTMQDLEGINLFLACGKLSKSKSKRVFDFDIDAGRIVASFQKEYGIDITSRDCSMHWWRFCDLLHNLSDDSALMQAVKIRQMDLPKGNDETAKKRKEQIAKAKRELKLPAKTKNERYERDREIWSD